MFRMWQAIFSSVLILCIGASIAAEEEKKAAFEYKPPIVGPGIFSDKLGMLDKEREEYAHNLATYAGQRISETKASKEALAQARRVIALSMHLSPRNRKAVVMNYQLQRGLLPAMEEGDYSAEVLATLLLTRGQLLLKSQEKEDHLLGRCFIEVAADMDAKNEDAVYASEMLRMDNRKVDWSELTDVKVTPEPPAP